jgi:1-acyl-sn-glycerol-3-phosphate acyltransferase
MRARPGRGLARLTKLLWTAFEACVHFAVLRLKSDGPLPANTRAQWLHRWCVLALRRLGVDPQHEGALPSRGLIVANHLSYLDILLLSAVCPCTFVAKKEVRLWPVFGWMATLSGTVFVDRQRPLDTGRINDQLHATMQAGVPVVLFPEGTSSNGTQVLPFRSPLFAAAVYTGEAITPAYISYQVSEGSVADDVCYWGDMTFFPHLLRLLSLSEVKARVRFSAEALRFDDRKQAAEITREHVVALSK